MPIPTPEQEALQDPIIEPGDLRQMGIGAAKALFSIRDLIPLLGLMRSAQKRTPYLPPQFQLEERFSPTMPPSYYSRPLPHNGSDLITGDQAMRGGFDPYGPGWNRTWAPQNADIDYMPPQIRDPQTAARYMQNWIQKHLPDRFGPTDDGLYGTPKGRRLDELSDY